MSDPDQQPANQDEIQEGEIQQSDAAQGPSLTLIYFFLALALAAAIAIALSIVLPFYRRR